MHTLINVCGPSRCGSTMLDLMLGSGEDAFSCGEVHAYFRPSRLHHLTTDLPPEWDYIKSMNEGAFHKAVAMNRNVDFVIDSSKHLPWLLDAQRWAANKDMKVYNLLVWRDPVDYAHSLWKRGNFESWRDYFVRSHTDVFEANIEFASVDISDLIDRPGAKLKEICDYVGMPYFEGKHQFWKHDHSHLFGSGGARRQIERGTSEIRSTNHAPDYAPYAENVRDAERHDAELRRVLETLEQHEISNATRCENGHRHGKPSATFLMTRYYPLVLKRLYQRLRLWMQMLGRPV